MLLALDLTARQAARVLAQALRCRVKLEIEPRPETCTTLLWGTLVSGERDLLKVDLHDFGDDVSLAALTGATCDVRSLIGGELYLFSTFIVEATENTVPQRLVLATPELIQVANRRRVMRKTPHEPVPLRLTLPSSPQPFVAELANIGQGGIGCRLAQGELEQLLLIGDEVQLEFVLPWSSEVYRLPAIVCGKTAYADDRVVVGFEFRTPDPAAAAALERLRIALTTETARLSDTNGEP